MKPSPTLLQRCFAEALGTFLLVLFGCGVVHAKVLTGAQSGLWQVAIVWGVAIMLANYVVGGVSGAHINPAMTIAFWVWRGFPARQVLPYLGSQFAGTVVAASCLLVLYGPSLEQREMDLDLTRGAPGSEMTAMCFGEYYPNPGRMEPGWRKLILEPAASQNRTAFLDRERRFVSTAAACLAEFVGTLILALVVFAVIDERNPAAPQSRLAPVFIGLTVSILISVIDPLTQAGFNPARDFGPRTVAWLAGWDTIAWPGPAGWDGTLLVYCAAPIAGAIAGGAVYDIFIRPAFPNPTAEMTP